jgi:VWFA-related protein
MRALALILTAAAAAQEPELTIKVEVDIVNLLCSVRSKKGMFLKDLQKTDFTVFEEGKTQEIRYFARETGLPLTIGLLVDVSKSQENLIEIERHASAQFFSKVLREKDMAFLISFGAEVELLQDVTNSARLLRKGLDDLRLNAGAGGVLPSPVPTSRPPRGTLLYDAVYLAAGEKLRREAGRKVIVLITDGVDQGSRMRLEEAVETAQKSDAIIYSIYYVDPRFYGYGFYGGGEGALKKLSEETGGRLFRVDRGNTLDSVFQEIQEEMRSQYAIGYIPANPNKDGGFRRVEIKTSQRDVKVLARKGYYATKP